MQYTTYADGSQTELHASALQGVVKQTLSVGGPSNPSPLYYAGEVGTFTDELGNTSSFRTDRFGHMTEWTDPLGNTTTWTRDSDGHVTTLTEPDPDGAGPHQAQVTQYEYDGDNVTQITYADGSTESWTYGVFDRPTSHTDTLGQQTLWNLDATTGDVLSMTQVVGQVDSPANGETDDVTTTYTYTAAPQNAGDLPGGLPLTETDPLGRVTQGGNGEMGPPIFLGTRVATGSPQKGDRQHPPMLREDAWRRSAARNPRRFRHRILHQTARLCDANWVVLGAINPSRKKVSDNTHRIVYAAKGWVAPFSPIPMEAADWGAQGIVQVTEAVEHVRRRHNPDLRLLGYLVSRFKRARAYQQSYVGQLRRHFGANAFDTVVPDLAQFEKSVTDRIPITFHALILG